MKKVVYSIGWFVILLVDMCYINSGVIRRVDHAEVQASYAFMNEEVSEVDSNVDKKYSALRAYKAVLKSECKYLSIDERTYVYLDKYKNFMGMNLDKPVKTARFTVVDLDSDEIPEVVLYIEDIGYIVLHYVKDEVFGYNIVYRALLQLKMDGTFGFSSGAADNGVGKLIFSDNSSEIDSIGYAKSNFSNGDISIRYYVNQKEVLEEEYYAFSEKQRNKKDVVWYEFTNDNIEFVFMEMSR